MDTIFYAFLLTLLAGLSTGIGSLIALLAKRTNRRFLSVSLGFSAGVMVYVSMIEIFAKAFNTNISDAVVFAVLIVVLLVKPSGLLGKYVPEKV